MESTKSGVAGDLLVLLDAIRQVRVDPSRSLQALESRVFNEELSLLRSVCEALAFVQLGNTARAADAVIEALAVDLSAIRTFLLLPELERALASPKVTNWIFCRGQQ